MQLPNRKSLSRYSDNGDGTITDNASGLTWQKGSSADLKTWEGALSYCESLFLGQHNDWRLPTISELRSLLYYDTYNPAINIDYFPNTNASVYWSSTSNSTDPSQAWMLNFYDAFDSSEDKETKMGYVRAVRGLTTLSTEYFVEPLGNCGGKTPCYLTIQAAIEAASSGALIMIAGGKYVESIALNINKSLTLQGGWDASFANPKGGTTILKGAPKAPEGSLTLQNLRIIP